MTCGLGKICSPIFKLCRPIDVSKISLQADKTMSTSSFSPKGCFLIIRLVIAFHLLLSLFKYGELVIYSISFNKSDGLTSRALAICTIFSRLILRSPLSTEPIYVLWRDAKSASCSCESEARWRKAFIVSPSLSFKFCI